MSYLNLLKGLAIIGVVLVHSPLLISDINVVLPMLLHFGAFGCQLFFVVSGYLMMASYNRILENTNTGDCIAGIFLKKRFFKIAPSYIICVFFYQLVSTYIDNTFSDNFYTFSHSAYSIILNIFLLHGFDFQNINKIVPGGWFIGTIFVFYLIFPLLRKLVIVMTRRKMNLFILPIVYAAVAILVQVLIYFFCGSWNFVKPGTFMYYSFINQLPCFLFGMILFQYNECSFTKMCLTKFFVFFAMANFLYMLSLVTHCYWICLFIPLFLGMSFFNLFIYIKNHYEKITFKLKRLTRALEWCGVMSFSIYYTNFIGAFLFPWLFQKLLNVIGVEISGTFLYCILVIPIFSISFALAPIIEKINYKISQRIL